MITNSLDTTNIITYKDSTLKNGKTSHIIIIRENKKEEAKNWYENSVITSLLVPIILTFCTIWITRFLNRKKELAEQEKIKEEISKLQTENKNMRKSFQPIVISSLQIIQSEVLKVKIDGLKALNEFKRNLLTYDGPSRGDGLDWDEDDYLENIFWKFNSNQDEIYKDFLLQYSYVFPDTVITDLTSIEMVIGELTETNSTMSADNPDPDYEDIKRVKQLIIKMDEAIKALRTDLHLDDDFIHKFIKQNQDIS
jgi:hypothetical protein